MIIGWYPDLDTSRCITGLRDGLLPLEGEKLKRGSQSFVETCSMQVVTAERHPEIPQTTLVDVKSLLPGDSPRLSGENINHIRMLAELDQKLPPILVHRQTGEVIDGRHRLRAADLRGESQIEVIYYDGEREAAFVEAVEANTKHGLPLTKADREAAAEKIIKFFPRWSDRSISKAAGLSAKKVSSIRDRLASELPAHSVRIGKDGRARPLDSSAGRYRAAQIMSDQPDASLSAIARESGISIGTVRDVRERLRRGEHPIPNSFRKDSSGEPEAGERFTKSRHADRKTIGESVPQIPDGVISLRTLERDPSLRHSDTGRKILRLIAATHIMSAQQSGLIDSLPSHCTTAVADLARHCAQTWSALASELDRRYKAGLGA